MRKVWALVSCLLSLAFLVSPASADVSTQCVAAWEYLFKNESTMLALMIDATGKAIDDLGKWDQCQDLPLAHYCYVRFAIPIPVASPYIGTCVPKACNETDISVLVGDGIDLVNASYAYLFRSMPALINITAKLMLEYQKLYEYEKASGQLEYYCVPEQASLASEPSGVIMVFVSFVLVGLVVVGTLLDGYDSHWWPEKDPDADVVVASIQGEERNPLLPDSAPVAPARAHLSNRQVGKPALFKFFIAFSVVRNYKSLIGPSPPALAFLNGLRAISIMWVILGHSLDYMNFAGVTNYAHVVAKDAIKWTAMVYPASEFSVDTFFWLSGFLSAFLTINELKNKKGVNWFLYYFHRIWRLSPAYYYVLGFWIHLSIHFGEGPMWPKFLSYVDTTCSSNWWANVLYINNFVPTLWANQCMLWSWYLAVDMQLYIVAPAIFITYHRNKIAGWGLVIALIVVTIVLNGTFAHHYNFVWNDVDPHLYMSNVYGKPYMRAGPWLLGILCAFLYLEKRQVERLPAYIALAISGVIMALCVYGPVTEFQAGAGPISAPKNTWTSSDNLMYFTFAKFGWSVALSIQMFLFALGYGSFVRRFLAAHFWSPLARLTYSTYLFHPIIMFIVYYAHGQYWVFDNYSYSIMFIGEMFLAFLVGAVMYFALERPMVNMEKLFLPHGKH